jgi:hypothetical protein
MLKRVLFVVAGLLLVSLLSAVALAQEPRAEASRQGDGKAERLARVLENLGESVGRYQAGLFSIAFTETVREERLKRDLKTPDGKAKEYVFESIALRQPVRDGAEDLYAKNVRQLKAEDGKPAKRGQPYVQKRHKCGGGGPAASYADPLTFLLPRNQPRYEFADEGEARLDGRAVSVVRFAPRGQGGPKALTKGDCFWASVPLEGRVWVDAESGDVLQLEWRMVEPYEFESPRVLKVGSLRFGPKRRMRYERMETLTRFRRVEFKDPAETLLLPVSFESLYVIEGASRPRVRTTQTFTDYQRFVSDVKVVEDEEPDN